MTRTITITMPLSDEFLSDILITASEAHYGWFRFYLRKRKWRLKDGRTVLNETGVSADTAICLNAPLDYDDPKDDEGSFKGRFTLDLDSVAEGIRRILTAPQEQMHLHPLNVAIVRDAVATQDAGQIDADAADWIVQAVIFNDVIYG